MAELLSLLTKKQEQNIFTFGKDILLSKKAKCPRCKTKIVLNHAAKTAKPCFFCANCQLMFEKK